ncbi:Flagellar motor rotation protein MotB [hydrothermal vent metagenome]|uniref:Flagellar motor rotation protein MotB n=1 Tax=hydrothermal vent metagenome TaxID=652676 RepID=A0A3B0S3R7_9ZZZZ
MIINLERASKGKTSESWLIIFADLLALLLTFFVLLFSMSSVQVSKWEAIVESLSENLNPNRALIQEVDWQNIEAAMVPQEEALSLVYLKKIFEDKLQYDPILRRSSVTLLGDRLAITLPADLIFEKGQSEFSRDAYKSMGELGASLQSIQNKITVVGHTDLEPTSGRRYPTNWELSLVRAISVARLIEDAGYTKNIETYGNGPSRFDDLDETVPLDERYLLARRVDIFIHREDRDQPSDTPEGR